MCVAPKPLCFIGALGNPQNAGGCAIYSTTLVRFPARTRFHDILKQRVEQYFTDHNLGKTGDWRLFLKTAFLFTCLAASYLFLVFFATSLLGTILGVFALAQSFALLGFNVAHDGAHESYARSKTVNWLMGCTFDLLGGSQMLWRQKHNKWHHTYTNIDGFDEDIDSHGWLRLSPQQPWYPWHRLQHYYAFVMYGFLTLSWMLVGDFRKILLRRIGRHKLQPMTFGNLCFFCGAKVLYFSYMLVLPWCFHPWHHVLMAFVGIHVILGFTLSMAFQLAHTVERNSFPAPDEQTGMMARAWAVHEVETTANFAPRNPFVTWYLGGLNFQIEHHLFSSICHRHYPALSALVAETCREWSLPYVSYPTVWAAIIGHYRLLKTLGRRGHVTSVR